jgi:predicted HicB family RNase H-like nuclease
MPRSKSKSGKPINAAGVELKSIRLELDPATHKALRVEAANHDKSMAAFVRTLVEDYFAKRKGSGK